MKGVDFVYAVYKMPSLFESTSSYHSNSACWSLHERYQRGLGVFAGYDQSFANRRHKRVCTNLLFFLQI